jgi:hypothetical protein
MWRRSAFTAARALTVALVVFAASLENAKGPAPHGEHGDINTEAPAADALAIGNRTLRNRAADELRCIRTPIGTFCIPPAW